MALLVAAIDLIADGVALVDLDGTVVFVNEPLCELLGYAPDDLVGRAIEMLVPSSQRTAHRRARVAYGADAIERRMGRADLDIEALHRDGRQIPVDVQITPLPGTTVVAATIRDMTGERRVAADRAFERGDLVATMRRNDQMRAYYDVMLQHLFALGSHLQAEAHRDTTGGSTQFLNAASVIDDLIDLTRSQVFGPDRSVVGPAGQLTTG